MEEHALSRSSGILIEQRQKNPWPADRDFRVLSIDGGGIKGLLPVSILARLEEHFRIEHIGAHFDLIVGTSTGGIIALGLGKNLSAREIRSIYLERGERVFPPLTFRGRARSLLMARRDPRLLAEMIHTTFGSTLLGESSRRLCVPSLDAEFGGEVFVFKTPHHHDYRRDWKRTMATVALATSAAPHYLKPFRNGWNEFLDGGVWCNNPTRIGVIEALTAFDVQPHRVKVLSLGCVESRYQIGWTQRALGGLIFWAGNMIEASAHFQSLNAIGESGLLIGRKNLLRVASPHIVDAIELDDWKKASQILPSIAQQLFDEYRDQIHRTFLLDTVDAYKPWIASDDLRLAAASVANLK